MMVHRPILRHFEGSFGGWTGLIQLATELINSRPVKLVFDGLDTLLKLLCCLTLNDRHLSLSNDPTLVVLVRREMYGCASRCIPSIKDSLVNM